MMKAATQDLSDWQKVLDVGGFVRASPGFASIRITITDIVFHPRDEPIIYVSGNQDDAEQIGVLRTENQGNRERESSCLTFQR
jgi:hypothetical protein